MTISSIFRNFTASIPQMKGPNVFFLAKGTVAFSNYSNLIAYQSNFLNPCKYVLRPLADKGSIEDSIADELTKPRVKVVAPTSSLGKL